MKCNFDGDCKFKGWVTKNRVFRYFGSVFTLKLGIILQTSGERHYIFQEGDSVEYFKKNKIIGLALNCLFFICVGKMEANPSCSQIKVDGNKQIVSVWQELDSEANVSKIMGTYGIDSVAVCLSNCKATTSYQPVIAISRLKSNNAPAVAVWKALDLSTQDQILQVATATKKGWIAHSPFTLSDPKAEVPQSEYNVDISDDGKVIGVTWNTYLIYEKKNAIRRVYSLDGGVTWSSPATLGP